MRAFSAVVLAGGAGRRMGGVVKPLLEVGGASMLERVLAALSEADEIVVVGPAELAEHLPQGVGLTQEDPPGSGPVAGIAAGVQWLTARRGGELGTGLVAVVGGDLPFLTADAVALLRQNTREVALYVDDEGRRQPMVAVWSASALVSALSKVPFSMFSLINNAEQVADVTWPGGGMPPWLDCDTPQELERAKRWLA